MGVTGDDGEVLATTAADNNGGTLFNDGTESSVSYSSKGDMTLLANIREEVTADIDAALAKDRQEGISLDMAASHEGPSVWS